MNKKFVWGDEKESTRGFEQDYPLQGLDKSVEDAIEKQLDFPNGTSWFQHHENHRTLLECFWKHVQKGESLVFFYAKQVPLVEDTGQRVLIGAGRVLDYGPLTEYEYAGAKRTRSAVCSGNGWSFTPFDPISRTGSCFRTKKH